MIGSHGAMTASRWYQSWWAWWAKTISSSGLDPAHHLRRAAPTAASTDANEDTRFLEEPSLSTWSLLHFITRWSGNSKVGKRNVDDQRRWAGTHEDILRDFCFSDEEIEWTIALDTCVDVRLGLPVVGNDFVRLTVKNGEIDITPILTCDVPHALQLLVFMDIRECQGTVPVVLLSRRLESVGKRGAWLWKQILFWPTSMVENTVVGMSVSLAEETAVKDPEDDEAFRAKDKQMGVEWVDGLRACCQYFFSARAEFAGARMVHIGVDAAFVGGLHRMFGYFTLPFGSGCWAAPTDQFGSIAVSSAPKLLCRSDRFTKVYVDAFFRQPLFTVFEAHKLLCF